MTDILNLALSCTRTQRTHNPYGTYTLHADTTMADLGKALTDFIDYAMSTTNIYAFRGYFKESSGLDYARCRHTSSYFLTEEERAHKAEIGCIWYNRT